MSETKEQTVERLADVSTSGCLGQMCRCDRCTNNRKALYSQAYDAGRASVETEENNEANRSQRATEDEQKVSPRAAGTSGDLSSKSTSSRLDPVFAISGDAGTDAMCSAEIGSARVLPVSVPQRASVETPTEPKQDRCPQCGSPKPEEVPSYCADAFHTRETPSSGQVQGARETAAEFYKSWPISIGSMGDPVPWAIEFAEAYAAPLRREIADLKSKLERQTGAALEAGVDHIEELNELRREIEELKRERDALQKQNGGSRKGDKMAQFIPEEYERMNRIAAKIADLVQQGQPYIQNHYTWEDAYRHAQKLVMACHHPLRKQKG